MNLSLRNVFALGLLLLGWTAAAGDCRKLETVCIAGLASDPFYKAGVTTQLPCRSFGSDSVCLADIGRSCWGKRHLYECRSAKTINDCQPLRDRGCAQVGANCVEKDNHGSCVMHESRYQCPDKPETERQQTRCDQSALCLKDGADCFETKAPPDQDFGQTVAMMEMARQAGVYGANASLFNGYKEECSVKVAGGHTIKSCCNASSGGSQFSNYALLSAGVNVVGEAGREAVVLGSKYAYDALYNQVDSTLVNKGLKAMNGWASSLSDGVFNPNFGFYGFSFEYTFANGFQFVGFDPYTFALSSAALLAQQWLSCNPSEQTIAMKRGQNLCVHVESYCNTKFLNLCLEKKERHCCFNSKLAKIINRQGRSQLGMPMNSCEGFHPAQLQALNFAQMDLSEFIADLRPKQANIPAMTNKVQQSVQQRVKHYYEQ